MRAGHLLNVSYFCIVAGCFLALLGFVGCYGAIKESKIILMLITIVFQEEAFELLKNNYTGFGDKNFASYGWDSIMKTFHCCGLRNYTDFEGSYYQITKGRLYPKSCCRNPFSADCDGITATRDIIFTKLAAMTCSLTLFINLFRRV
ncbi:tetraspanin-16-like [Rhinoraja longicauda]